MAKPERTLKNLKNNPEAFLKAVQPYNRLIFSGMDTHLYVTIPVFFMYLKTHTGTLAAPADSGLTSLKLIK